MRKTLCARLGRVASWLLPGLLGGAIPPAATAEHAPPPARVLSIEAGRALGGIGDRLQGRGHFPQGVQHYLLYRLPEAPRTADALSLPLAGAFGQAELLAVQEDQAVLRVLKARHEVRPGDHLVPVIPQTSAPALP
ncbi:hypothetical protein [Pseudomonas sp. NW5]|uniref:hypothetical protein n=1 Tax=Pseudomonas sp. NW5 TaxID=2934934 RepID=UPI00202133B2|nr:hypothetical protein [Pseudomonas sp. NW5]MCL7461399.1 hypothetical protein [Pseudomonas sp. NW5]